MRHTMLWLRRRRPTPAAPAPVASNVSATGATLSWASVQDAVGYDLQRGPDSIGPWTSVYSGTGTMFDDETLTESTGYYYRLRAAMPDGEASISPLTWVLTLNVSTPPPVPTGLIQTGATPSSVTMSWDPTAGALSYVLQRGTTTVYSGTDTTYTDTPLSASTTYSYRVAAANSDGTSAYTATVTGTTAAAPASTVPATPTTAPTASNTDDTSTVLAWTAVATATGYTLQRGTSTSGPWTTIYSGALLTAPDSGLTASTAYYYRYSASNDAGPSAGYSPTLKVTTASGGVVTGDLQPLSAYYASRLVNVNTHANFGGSNGVYTLMDGVRKWFADMNFRGTRSLISADDTINQAYHQMCLDNGATWLQLGTRASTRESDATIAARIQKIGSKYAASCGAIEGINEPSHYLGGTVDYWMTQVIDIQKTIYQTVRSIPALDHVIVVGPAMHEAEALSAYNSGSNWWQMLADRGLLQYCDAVALHTYPTGSDPADQLDYRAGIVRAAWPNKPLWVTESGYSDAWTNTGGIYADAYGGRFPLEMLQRKIRYYHYELLDDAPSYQSGVQRVFGLVATGDTDTLALNTSNWTRKPLGTSLKAVTDKWAESVSADYTPTKVKCDVSASSTVTQVLTATKAQSDAGTATVFLYRPIPAGGTSIPVTVTDRAGSRTFNVGPNVTVVDLRAGSTSGATTMKMGSSAVPTDVTWTAGVAHQRSVLHMNSAYWYDTNNNQNWSDVAAVDSRTDLLFQWKGTTRAQADALLATFPATRTGKVYLHYFNEPEDNIEAGTLALSDWQARTDALYAAISASGKSYVIPSVELQYYTLQQTNKGNHGTNDGRWLPNYLRPGLQQVIYSAYAEVKLSNGHWVAGTDPVVMPNTIKAWMGTRPDLHVSIVSGWPLKSGYETDTVTLQNRVNWLNAVVPNLSAIGAQHYLWFDIKQTDDYRIEADPTYLEQAWLARTAAAGQ